MCSLTQEGASPKLSPENPSNQNPGVFSEWLAGVLFFYCLLLSKVVRLIDNLTTGVLENRKGLVGVPHREKGIPALIREKN